MNTMRNEDDSNDSNESNLYQRTLLFNTLGMHFQGIPQKREWRLVVHGVASRYLRIVYNSTASNFYHCKTSDVECL